MTSVLAGSLRACLLMSIPCFGPGPLHVRSARVGASPIVVGVLDLPVHDRHDRHDRLGRDVVQRLLARVPKPGPYCLPDCAALRTAARVVSGQLGRGCCVALGLPGRVGHLGGPLALFVAPPWPTWSPLRRSVPAALAWSRAR